MYTAIRTPPSVADDFVELAEYQSQTPETFFGGKPVLHYHALNARVWIPTVLDLPPALPIFRSGDGDSLPTGPEAAALQVPSNEYRVDVFVSSEYA